MPGGAGTRWYKHRQRVVRELALYAASPVLAVIGIIATFYPWTLVLVILVAGIVARVRPSK